MSSSKQVIQTTQLMACLLLGAFLWRAPPDTCFQALLELSVKTPTSDSLLRTFGLRRLLLPTSAMRRCSIATSNTVCRVYCISNYRPSKQMNPLVPSRVEEDPRLFINTRTSHEPCKLPSTLFCRLSSGRQRFLRFPYTEILTQWRVFDCCLYRERRGS